MSYPYPYPPYSTTPLYYHQPPALPPSIAWAAPPSIRFPSDEPGLLRMLGAQDLVTTLASALSQAGELDKLANTKDQEGAISREVQRLKSVLIQGRELLDSLNQAIPVLTRTLDKVGDHHNLVVATICQDASQVENVPYSKVLLQRRFNALSIGDEGYDPTINFIRSILWIEKTNDIENLSAEAAHSCLDFLNKIKFNTSTHCQAALQRYRDCGLLPRGFAFDQIYCSNRMNLETLQALLMIYLDLAPKDKLNDFTFQFQQLQSAPCWIPKNPANQARCSSPLG